MIDLTKVTDPYERKARIYPGLICLFPMIITVFTVSPEIFRLWSSLATLAISFGLLQLLANIARDRGKKLEPFLFNEWGGMPSIRILRKSDRTIPKAAKERYHKVLSSLTEIYLPPTNVDNDQSEEADDIYHSWSDYLRGKTRDSGKYPMVSKENVNYGFRRNLLGLRPFCICVGILCLALIIWRLSFIYRTSAEIDPLLIGTAAIVLIYVFVLIFVVNRQWVKLPADAYARQLIETLIASS